MAEIKSRAEAFALSETHVLVFFDGVCNLCNGFVDWTMRQDSQGKILFASLQSDVARLVLDASDVEQLTSIVVLSKGKVLRQSEAVLEVLSHLGRSLKVLTNLVRLLPTKAQHVLLNTAYDWAAQTRYRLFGKRDTCRVPTPEERARFFSL